MGMGEDQKQAVLREAGNHTSVQTLWETRVPLKVQFFWVAPQVASPNMSFLEEIIPKHIGRLFDVHRGEKTVHVSFSSVHLHKGFGPVKKSLC